MALLASAATGAAARRGGAAGAPPARAIFSEIASRGGIIQAGNFNPLDHSEQRLLFVEERDEQNRLSGVLISDRTDPTQPFTVVAERGRFSFDSENATAHLQLEEGDIHFESEADAKDHYRRIAFETFDYAFDMSAILGSDPSRIMPMEMRTKRLLEVIGYFDSHDGRPPADVRVKVKNRYEIQLHRRLALPFAPLLFALVGIPLGLRRIQGRAVVGCADLRGAGLRLLLPAVLRELPGGGRRASRLPGDVAAECRICGHRGSAAVPRPPCRNLT